MSEIQEKRKQIEQKIDEWRKEDRIVDVSKKRLNGETVIIRIQHSGQPFTVYFDGHACRVGIDGSEERSTDEFMWEQNEVVKKVLNHIEKLLNG